MTLVYFDTETGGTKPHHSTIELGAVAVENGIELASFEQTIQFDPTACDPDALALNHYTAARWTDAVGPRVCASRFARWLRPFCAVTRISTRTGAAYQVARCAGYNVGFDQPSLLALFGEQFVPCDLLMRDVLQAALFYFDERAEQPANFKLASVAAWFGLETDGAHGALADARLCAAVHRKLYEAMTAWL